MSLWEQITDRCGGCQFEPQGNRLQRFGWIYVVNPYALLHTIKAIGFMVSEDFLMFFPILRKLMTDPHGMAKLDPKGTVGTINAGDHKTLLYTKCINYGPHRKDFLKFLSMRAVDQQGLGQFAAKGSTPPPH